MASAMTREHDGDRFADLVFMVFGVRCVFSGRTLQNGQGAYGSVPHPNGNAELRVLVRHVGLSPSAVAR